MGEYFYLFDANNNLLHTVKSTDKPEGYKSFLGNPLADSEGYVDWTATTYDGALAAIPVPEVVTPTTMVVEKTAAEIAAERQNTLNLLTKNKEKALIESFNKAQITGNDSEASVYGNDYKNLQSLFSDYSAQITAGNDALTLYGNDAFIL